MLFLSLPVFKSISATVLALRQNKEFVNEIVAGESGQMCGVLLDSSCFYAEQGGQQADYGYMNKEGDEVGSLWYLLIVLLLSGWPCFADLI